MQNTNRQPAPGWNDHPGPRFHARRTRSAGSRPRSAPWLALIACLAVLATAGPAQAADAGELLEKGIYTEQTIGDLAEAIRVYEKVVAEGKQSQDTAAQAQFRIGVCYEKQGKTAQATEAFERVVQQYPGATRWVRQAKDRLPGNPELMPVPWGDGDELHLEMKLQTGVSIGTQIYRVAAADRDGRKTWECSSWQAVTLNGQIGKSHVVADGETFAPLNSQWSHTLLGRSKAAYTDDKVVIQTKDAKSPTTFEADGPWYDNEQAAELFRRLPLKVGYQTKLVVVSPLGGAKVPLELEVTKIESVEVPAGEFECFELKLDIGQTFWISTDPHRYIVKFAAGGAIAELTKIQPPGGVQSTTIKRERFAAKLPPDWYAYTPSDSKNESRRTTWLLDPDGMIDARIEAGPLDDVQSEHASPVAWIESSLEKYGKRMPNYSLSSVGVESIQVDGHDAAVADFEYNEGSQKKKSRRIAIFSDSSAVSVRLTTAADQFDASREAIAPILAGLNIQ